MSKLPVVLTNANQSFTDTQKAQARANIGVLSAGDTLTLLQNKLNKPSIVRSSYTFSDSAAAENLLYSYTAVAECIVDITVSIRAKCSTLTAPLSLEVRWEPVNDAFNTDNFSLNDQNYVAVSFRSVMHLAQGNVFNVKILNNNTSYPISGDGLIMGYMFTL